MTHRLVLRAALPATSCPRTRSPLQLLWRSLVPPCTAWRMNTTDGPTLIVIQENILRGGLAGRTTTGSSASPGH